MLTIYGPSDGKVSRRRCLQVGALGAGALTWPALRALGASPSAGRGSFGSAKRCLMIYMWGGPAHQDTFDLKPESASEYRSEFRPIDTSVPGIQFCEHFHHLAQQAHRMALIRSMTHSDNNHSTSAHWMLTGRKHATAAENFGARDSDFPHIGSVIGKLQSDGTYPRSASNLPAFISLPETIATTAGAVTPGQDGGILGKKFDPFRVTRHHDEKAFRVPDLQLPAGTTLQSFKERTGLLHQLERLRQQVDQAINQPELTEFQRQALSLVASPEIVKAFDLSREPANLREGYGEKTFGMSLMMARRLLEAGATLVTVYWHRDMPGVDSTWDTHAKNFEQLKSRLIPNTDQPVATLLQDLSDRGMLDDTLVVWNSEFGRTPKVNRNGGRDHWGKCNTLWLAGAGVDPGQVYGKSDAIASAPVSDPVTPADLSATIYHLLGIPPESMILDSLERPFPISEGRVLEGILA